MKKFSKNNAITLIVLVITIIVLLILAGVTIATLTGENGILTRSTEAKKKTEESKEEELRKLTQAEAATYLEEYEYTDTNGEKVRIPAKCAVSQVDYERTIKTGLVIIDSLGNSYVWIDVPKTTTVYSQAGIELTNFTEKALNDIYEDLKRYTKTYRIDCDDIYHEGIGLSLENYISLKNKMLTSIYQNGGFWVGQYETGSELYSNADDSAQRQPVIKKGAYPYNYISCSNAQDLATRFSTNNTTGSLLFGIQWDLILKFIEQNGNKTVSQLKNNSNEWGNFKDATFTLTQGKYLISPDSSIKWETINNAFFKPADSFPILLTTGATDRNSCINIYDLAGNVGEWTLEKSLNNDKPLVRRGGSCTNSNYPVYGRGTSPVGGSIDCYIGFRVTLF